jgi:hypothetical protein
MINFRVALLLPLAVWTAGCSVDEPGKNPGMVVEPGPSDTGGNGQTEEDPVPVSLEVMVDSYVGDVGQTFIVTVRVLDADGTEIPDLDTDYTVTNPDSVEILGPQLTILAEGIYVVTATLGDGSMATDSEPIRVDDNGPQITLTSPAPGTWLDADIALVQGTVVDELAGLGTVTVSGEAVEVAADGSFSHELSVGAGPTAIEVIATDIDGNAADAYVGVMSGEYVDPEAVYDGMRVGLGVDGIARIAAPLLTQLDASVVESSIKASNPLARGSVSCVDYRADVDSVSYGTPTLRIVPGTEYIGMEVELTDLEILVDVDLTLCSFGRTSDVITITDTITIISGDISAGYLERYETVFAAVLNGAVTYTDLEVDYGTIDSLLSTFGVSISDLGIDVGSIIEEAIVEVVEEEVPPPLVATLEAMEFTESLDVLGSVVTLETKTAGVNVTPSGVEVELETTTTGPAADPEMPALPGVVVLGGNAPELDPGTELALSLALQELNRILHLAHAAGAFRIQLSDAELGLEPALIDFVFPGATTLELSFEPSLPPVLLPDETGSALGLSMLSLELEARGLVDDVDTELLRGHVHVLGSVDAGINADGDISIEVTGITPVVDTVTPEASGVAAAEALEEQLATLAADIIGDLFPAITLAIPEVDGMTLTGTGAGPAGDQGTWLKVDAEVGE